MKRVCVFCGSSSGINSEYVEAARLLGRVLAQRRLTLVYGGGSVGLMGALADAALEAGGEVVGVIPRALQLREVGHSRLSALHVVSSMHERKAKMAELADAFVALPGGMGTLEEFSEILTWAQLGLHAKPCGSSTSRGTGGRSSRSSITRSRRGSSAPSTGASSSPPRPASRCSTRSPATARPRCSGGSTTGRREVSQRVRVRCGFGVRRRAVAGVA